MMGVYSKIIEELEPNKLGLPSTLDDMVILPGEQTANGSYY